MLDSLLSATPTAAHPVRPVAAGELDALPAKERSWATINGFDSAAGAVLVLPGEGGSASGALLGLGGSDRSLAERSMLAGALATALPSGDWHLHRDDRIDPQLAALGFLLGAYRFERYRKPDAKIRAPRLHVEGAYVDSAVEEAKAAFLARDLINTPANDLGPDGIEAAVRALAAEFGAEVFCTVGDDLLAANFPMIHAVGRASATAPRLVDMRWGDPGAPKVTLVGKGVAFDTGGLDIKSAASMLLMKKDMGGAANVLALARLVMSGGMKVRLRVLVPAVENAISGNAFRPGDILRSRSGRTVEIGNTDAEGRLILADALSLADEEAPRLLIDMATLTGAARVALGPELPPFYTDDEDLAAEIGKAAHAVGDPLWRMPLWRAYRANLASKIADTNNVTSDGMAGSVTAALFLHSFVEKAQSWVHLDIYGWRPKAGPTGPVGGEAQGGRALARVIVARFA